MLLDTGTLIAIVIALAGSCFVMVVGLKAHSELRRELNRKNQKIRFLEGEISRDKRKELNESR